jgi:(E)-2-((N-methylformamido)methylene)succinate hydrolase
VSHRETMLRDGTCARISGAGPALILLHGVGLNQSIWAEQVKAFAHSRLVVTYDLLGHGRSAAVPENATLENWVHQLVNLVEELKLERFSLVGFSFGGMIAQAYAAKHTDRIEKLILMSTVYDRSEEERASVSARLEMAQREGPHAIIGAALSRWFSQEFAAEFPVVIEGYERMLRNNDAGSFLAAYRCFATGDRQLVDMISRISCPTLVMTGEVDGGSTPDMARRLAATIPSARCFLIPQGRHMMPVERPEEVNSVLHHFLNGGSL